MALLPVYGQIESLKTKTKTKTKPKEDEDEPEDEDEYGDSEVRFSRRWRGPVAFKLPCRRAIIKFVNSKGTPYIKLKSSQSGT